MEGSGEHSAGLGHRCRFASEAGKQSFSTEQHACTFREEPNPEASRYATAYWKLQSKAHAVFFLRPVFPPATVDDVLPKLTRDLSFCLHSE